GGDGLVLAERRRSPAVAGRFPAATVDDTGAIAPCSQPMELQMETAEKSRVDTDDAAILAALEELSKGEDEELVWRARFTRSAMLGSGVAAFLGYLIALFAVDTAGAVLFVVATAYAQVKIASLAKRAAFQADTVRRWVAWRLVDEVTWVVAAIA